MVMSIRKAHLAATDDVGYNNNRIRCLQDIASNDARFTHLDAVHPKLWKVLLRLSSSSSSSYSNRFSGGDHNGGGGSGGNGHSDRGRRHRYRSHTLPPLKQALQDNTSIETVHLYRALDSRQLIIDDLRTLMIAIGSLAKLRNLRIYQGITAVDNSINSSSNNAYAGAGYGFRDQLVDILRAAASSHSSSCLETLAVEEVADDPTLNFQPCCEILKDLQALRVLRLIRVRNGGGGSNSNNASKRFDLGDLLHRTRSLQELSVQNKTTCNLMTLVEALHVNKTLVKLDLRYQGAQSHEFYSTLEKALLVNTSLRQLLLKGCDNTAASGFCFARIIQSNSSLRILELPDENGFHISKERTLSLAGYQAMEEALVTNTSLTQLTLPTLRLKGLSSSSYTSSSTSSSTTTTAITTMAPPTTTTAAHWKHPLLSEFHYLDRIKNFQITCVIYNTLNEAGRGTLVPEAPSCQNHTNHSSSGSNDSDDDSTSSGDDWIVKLARIQESDFALQCNYTLLRLYPAVFFPSRQHGQKSIK